MRFRDIRDLDPELLGSRIREARERVGISQGDLAARVSKDQRAISEYEHGKRKLAAVDLPAFAEALEVPVSYFYEGDIVLERLDELLLSEFDNLSSEEVKRAAIDILRVLSQLK